MSAEKAMNMPLRKVQELQTKLSCAAKQSLNRRFGALYDKVYREDVLRNAWQRVRANKGAPGIDNQSIDYIEEVIGVSTFLEEIQKELHAQKYRPLPVQRCWIDKPGKPEKRPLGIPIVKDRVAQMAAKLILEPIFEANFMQCSYGFRPGRSAHDAISMIDRKITFDGYNIVVDADIKGYFDSIDHTILMKLVERRISDPRMLKLIRSWLKAGVIEAGQYKESNEMGTPQGGVISPLLSNIYLHSFDKMFSQSGIPGILVRYADDFVIMLKGNATGIKEKVQGMLERLKLKLHPEKTRIVTADTGFDFLGVHFRRRPVSKKGSRLKQSCRIWPSDRSMQRLRQNVRETIGKRYGTTVHAIIQDLNPVLRGWNNYQTKVQSEPKRFRALNSFVRENLRIFFKRKYDDRIGELKRQHLLNSDCTNWVRCGRSSISTTKVADKRTGKVIGEPYWGKLDVRFDEGAEGMKFWAYLCL